MSETFNPFAEWLGLAETVTSPNHYQLLGIDETVSDPVAIATAADRAMTRVRACKPGANAAAWAQLLDRITDAKKTLTDAAQRERYDQQRKSPVSVTTAAPINPNLLPPSHGVANPMAVPTAPRALDPMAPMTPVLATPQMPQQNQAAVPQAVPYLQPAAPVAPNPMAPIANPVPMSAMMPTAPQAMPNPMAPFAQAAPIAQAIPLAPSPMAPMHAVAIPVAAPSSMPATPVASPMLTSPSVPASPEPTVSDAPLLKRKPSATARAQSNAAGLLGPILLGGSVGGLILVVVGVGFYLAGSPPESPSQVATIPPPVTTPSGVEVTSTIPRRLDEIPESERPQPQTYTPPTTAPISQDFGPINMSPPPDVSMTTEPAPEMTPEPMTPEPIPAVAPSREELRSLAQSLTTARNAIGEMNFSMADQELAKATSIAKLDDHKAKIRRLQILSDYVSRFRAAIGQTLGRVNAGDQITLEDDKSFGIVEISPETLIIRYSGRNLRYPMSELPPGLATRLAEMSLDKDAPGTIAMKAAFVSVNPKLSDADRDKVETWWTEAASVADVQDLITAINDDYSLRQDMMDVPLDPNAMAALTERADRLKGARTIEAFAKEYQAAIDESLKSLEPEMELSVGGSTTVVIKELKSDRIMLTVAEETRGFQLTKLPLGLAASLAERNLPRDAPLTMVMKGAYYAAREKGQSNKQFRPLVIDWWRQAGEMDQQLQPVIRELATQYPE